MSKMPDDDPLQPIVRPDFDLVARVRRVDRKLYAMRLYRVSRAKEGQDELLGMIMFRDEEWAQIVPGLRHANVTIDYVEA